MSQHVRIVMTAHGRGEVFVNGVKVAGVHTFTMLATAKAPEANELVLHLHPEQIEVEGPFDVTTIDSEAREYRVSPHLPEPMPKHPPGSVVVLGEESHGVWKRVKLALGLRP